jgi:N-methylhydantoinase B/oxoprolinase/acetone carboxylase alpha subunit
MRPFGAKGGEPGEADSFVALMDVESLGACAQALDPGEAIIIKTPTGGGFGHASE